MFVIDSNAEEIAVKEARRMGVPVVSVVDTNCDPDVVDWIIPGNDDALRAIRLFTSKISESVIERPQRLRAISGWRSEGCRGPAAADGVEYVDTSAYEQYEKQEGDFVEGAEVIEALKPEVAELPSDGSSGRGISLIQRG